jgi:F0F1-type ATP synthase membrane subunit a
MSSLGCSTRLLVIIAAVVLILFLVGLVGGAIGEGLLGERVIGLLDVPPLEIHSFFKGDVLFEAGPLGISNTLLASWVTILVVVGLAFAATRKMKVIPGRLQALFEAALELLLSFVESVAGHKNGRRFFPVIATIFIFVMFNAYLALLPVYGPGIYVQEEEEVVSPVAGTVIGLPVHAEEGKDIVRVEEGEVVLRVEDESGTIVDVIAPKSGEFEYHEGLVEGETAVEADEAVAEVTSKPPLLRSASTDINMTLALALMAVLFIELWGLTGKGFRNYVGEYVNVKELGRGIKLFFKGKVVDALMATVTGVINVIIGGLEAFSHMMRAVSFAFRLFGNMTAGEILVLSATFLIPWIMAVPFYGLELLIGFIQALIFGGLTLVFGSIAVAHEGEEH